MNDEQQTSSPVDENEALKKEIEEMKKKVDEYLNGWKRATADYQNLQKETAREREEFARFALERTLRDFLEVLDRGGAALSQAPQDGVNDHTKEWVRGVHLIFEGFTNVMASYGVQKIETVGTPFDPMRHEAVGSRSDAASEPGTVCAEVRPGYTLHGRILRPAQVIISE